MYKNLAFFVFFVLALKTLLFIIRLSVFLFFVLFICSDMGSEEVNLCSEMLLNLFHVALPYLKPNAQRVRESRKLMSKGKKVNADKLEMEVKLKMLCTAVSYTHLTLPTILLV